MAYKSSGSGYADVAAHFRQLIQDGELTPGDPLPSVDEIRQQFGVSAKTVSRALRVLKDEGLATSRGSLGTVVTERPRSAATGAARLDRLNRTGKMYAPGETSSDHKAVLLSVDDRKVADALGVDLRDEVLIRYRVFRHDGKPTTVGYSFFHPRAWAVVPELLQQGQLKPFWQETYTERTGKKVTRSPEQRRARLASSDELAALEIEMPEGAVVPVLVLHTTFHTEDGPVEVWEDVLAPGLSQTDTKR